tara:strand:- start:1004 stop:1321 length:318 start_codon:yes stop_codon:yes gene_type:complete
MSNDPHLASVRQRIGPFILEWCAARLERAPEFRADDLRRAVHAELGCAPGSSDRILRTLRQSGELSYSVVSRSRSLYRIEWVGTDPTPKPEVWPVEQTTLFGGRR